MFHVKQRERAGRGLEQGGVGAGTEERMSGERAWDDQGCSTHFVTVLELTWARRLDSTAPLSTGSMREL